MVVSHPFCEINQDSYVTICLSCYSQLLLRVDIAFQTSWYLILIMMTVVDMLFDLESEIIPGYRMQGAPLLFRQSCQSN